MTALSAFRRCDRTHFGPLTVCGGVLPHLRSSSCQPVASSGCHTHFEFSGRNGCRLCTLDRQLVRVQPVQVPASVLHTGLYRQCDRTVHASALSEFHLGLCTTDGVASGTDLDSGFHITGFLYVFSVPGQRISTSAGQSARIGKCFLRRHQVLEYLFRYDPVIQRLDHISGFQKTLPVL